MVLNDKFVAILLPAALNASLQIVKLLLGVDSFLQTWQFRFGLAGLLCCPG